MIEFLLGATTMASAVVGLAFLRFYRRTHDRFFLFFAASFWLDALSRVWNWQRDPLNESDTVVFVVRLIAYSLILAAIVDKNLRRDGG